MKTLISNKPYQQIRIFLSSTFKDLDEERQYLITKVFPIFTNRLRKRGVDFSVIDLRWGIQPEERVNDKGFKERASVNSLEVCLKEVERSYPFFIGILGGRYGWIPEKQDIDLETDFFNKDNRRERVEKYLKERKSITEMEMLFGALERVGPPINYLFYLGDEAIYTDKIESYDIKPNGVFRRTEEEKERLLEEAQDKIKQLRTRIIESNKTHDKVFTDATSLGNLISEDLEYLITYLENNDLIPKGELSNEELINLEHKSFEVQKTKGYIARQADEVILDYVQQVLKYRQGDILRPLIIVGPSGTGKSSLLANCAMKFDGTINIIKIYIGNQGNISYQRDLIKILLNKIKETYNIDEEIPSEDEMLLKFEQWIRYIPEPTLIIIDGINQLLDFSPVQSWIPKYLHQNLGIIVTSTSEIQISHINEKTQIYNMIGFSNIEKEKFINQYLINESKQISIEAKNAFMEKDDELGCNPLYISALLKESIRSGKKDIYTEEELQKMSPLNESVLGIIEQFKFCKDMESMYQKLFERYERDYGKELVEKVLCFIALSRKGIYYQELTTIIYDDKEVEVSGIEFQSLFSVLEEQLIHISSSYSFYHIHIKNALNRRYPKNLSKYRKQLATYFSIVIRTNSEEVTLHHVEEITYQLSKLNKWDDLFKIICQSSVLKWMLLHYQDELSGYFGNFKELSYDFRELYDKVINSINFDEFPIRYFAVFLRDNGEIEIDIKMNESYAIYLSEKYGNDHPDLWLIWADMASAYNIKGEVSKAIELHEQVAAKQEALYGNDHPDLWATWNDLGMDYDNKGECDKAIKLYQQVAAKREKKYGEDYYGLWVTLHNLACAYNHKGQVDEAIKLFERVANKKENKFGENDLDLWITLSSLAIAYNKKGELDKAIKILEEVVSKCEIQYGSDYPALWMRWNNLALIYIQKGELDKAIILLEKAESKMQSKYGTEYPDLWTIWMNLAVAYNKKGESDKAFKIVKKVACKQEAKFGEDYPELWISWNILAVIYEQNGKLDKAIELHEKVSSKQEAKFGDDYPELWETWNNLALDYYKKGIVNKTVELLEKVITHQQGKYGDKYPNLWFTWRNLAYIYYESGELDKAIELYKKISILQKDKYGEDFPELWETWYGLAEAYYEKGEIDKTIKLYEKILSKEDYKHRGDFDEIWIKWNDLARAYKDKGNLDKAIELYEKVAIKREEIYGEDDSDLWATWRSLARTYYDKGKFNKAIQLYEKLASKFKVEYGEDCPDLWKLWHNLGVAHHDKGNLDKAIELYEKVAIKREQTYGEDDSDLWITWNYLAQAYQGKANLDRAIELYEKVVSKREQTYGEDNPDLWATWRSLARTYYDKGKFNKAIQLYEKLASKFKVEYGEDCPDLWKLWHNLGVAHHDKGNLDKAIELYEKVAIKREQTYGEDDSDLWITWNYLAQAYQGKANLDRAIELYEKVVSKREQTYGEDDSSLDTVRKNLCLAYEAKKREKINLATKVFKKLGFLKT